MLQTDSSLAVIGASGFIGGALAKRLEREGIDYEGYTRLRPFVEDGHLAPGVEEADVVFWLVSSISPSISAGSNGASEDLRALRHLLEGFSRRGRRPPRVVAVSSGGTVYDMRTPPPYSESSPTRGANEYGKAMLAVEALIGELAEDFVVLRASNAYGPGQRARRGQGVIAHWLDGLQKAEPVRVLGDPATRRDYLYIDDLVDALLRAASVRDLPPVINIGTGTGTSLSELLECLSLAVGRRIPAEFSPSRGFDAPSTWLDVALAKKTLDFEASVTLEDGLRRAWFALS